MLSLINIKRGYILVLENFLKPFKNKVGESNLTLNTLLGHAVYFANNKNKEALEDLQRLVMRPIQSRHMVDAYLMPSHGATESLYMWTDLGIDYIPGAKQTLDEFITDNRQLQKEKLPLAKLGQDIILPTCWSPHSIRNLLGKVGLNRKLGSWVQDPNHSLTWCYPMNIFWVNGGNHSITQGIVIAQGELKPVDGFDLSDMYNFIKFDGDEWIDIKSGSKLGAPRYKEFGYIYEIGRYILAIEDM